MSVAPPKPALPVVQKSKDEKALVREAMVAVLQKDRSSADRFVDLDDLIKNRNDDIDVDVDELIHNAQASIEKLDSLIYSVRSLVAKNDKVMKRCGEFHCGPTGDFTFQRIVIDCVQVESFNEKDGKSLIIFKTTPRRETKRFGVPAPVPAEIAEIIVVKPGFAGLPDYDLLFERSLLLQNDVLKPFLLILRGHLEKIQAFYNEIDVWIREPRSDRHFLEQTFGIDFDFSFVASQHEEEDNSTQPTTIGQSDTSSRSSDDAESYSNDIEFAYDYTVTMEEKAESDDIATDDVRNGMDSCDEEEHEEINDDEDSEDEQPTVLHEKVDLAPYNKSRWASPDKEIIMKQYLAEGNYALSFQVNEDGQKGKLEKFLEFLAK